MGITGGLVAGGLGVAKGLFGQGGLFGGPSPASQVQLPPQFNMPNQGAAANAAFGDIGNLPGTNLGQQTTPLAWNTAQNLYNNPYASGYLGGSQTAGALGQGAALNAYGMGGNIGMAGANLLPLGGAIAQNAFDPQSALYARTLGQVTDQTRAGLEARGIDNTPYGAGVEGQTLGNFNIDWQNNELQRMIQGASGAAGITGAAGSAFNTAAGLQGGAAPGFLAASSMPYSAYGNIGTGQFGALTGAQNVAQGGQGLAQTPIQDYFGYLGLGNQAGQVANQGTQLALNQAGMGWQQQQSQMANLGFGLGALGSSGGQAFPNAGFGGRGGQPFNPNAYAGYNVTGTPWGG